MKMSAFLIIYIGVVADLPGFEELFAGPIEADLVYSYADC